MVHCIKVQQILFAGCVASWCSLSLSLVIIKFESPKHTRNHKALQLPRKSQHTQWLHDGWVVVVLFPWLLFQWLFLLCGRKQAWWGCASLVESTADSAMCGQAWWNQQPVLPCVDKPCGINSRFCHVWTSLVESTADSAMCGQAWWN